LAPTLKQDTLHQNAANALPAGQLTPDVRLVAYYLPQFHPTPENDKWWGKGFTEWTNTTKAQPLYDGHYQPHLPTEMGFYDLRLRQSRHDQIALAKQHGIDAFCYHYYWFSGTRLLHEPVDDMLADPESDMPFCLCWANENWTRRWDAAEKEILIAQKYAADDDVGFIKSVVPFFNDRRYVRLDGAPVLIVYRPQHLPNSKKSIAIWRDYCASVGIPKLHVVCALTHGNLDYAKYGFDAGVEFPPHHPAVPSVTHEIDYYNEFTGVVFDFKEIATLYLERDYPATNVYRAVFPSWDNTARLGGRALVTLNGTPQNYEYWLSAAIKKTRADFPGQQRLVFINAWNEWAEGCHLEPDRKYGRGFLEATLRAKQGQTTLTDFTHVGPPPRRAAQATTAVESAVGADVTAAAAGSEVAGVTGGTTNDPPPPPRVYQQPSVAHQTLMVGRRAIGKALAPFPSVRQRMVQVYLALFDRGR
jgi:lipopolysaccharide biosynthesis protein